MRPTPYFFPPLFLFLFLFSLLLPLSLFLPLFFSSYLSLSFRSDEQAIQIATSTLPMVFRLLKGFRYWCCKESSTHAKPSTSEASRSLPLYMINCSAHMRYQFTPGEATEVECGLHHGGPCLPPTLQLHAAINGLYHVEHILDHKTCASINHKHKAPGSNIHTYKDI